MAYGHFYSLMDLVLIGKQLLYAVKNVVRKPLYDECIFNSSYTSDLSISDNIFENVSILSSSITRMYTVIRLEFVEVCKVVGVMKKTGK